MSSYARLIFNVFKLTFAREKGQLFTFKLYSFPFSSTNDYVVLSTHEISSSVFRLLSINDETVIQKHM